VDVALRYQLHPGDRIALLEANAELEFEQWEGQVGAMLDEPAFTAEHKILFDRRGVTALESEAFVQAVLNDLEHNAWRLRDTLWAIVIGDTPESCGRARSLAHRATRFGIETRVFTDLIRARVWLLESAPAVLPVAS